MPSLPRVAPRARAADPTAWGDAGLRVEVLAPDTAAPPDPAEASAQLWLGWEPRGVVLLVAVRGQRWTEWPQAKRAFVQTAIELLLRDPAQPTRSIQAVVSPGVAADQPTLRIAHWDHRRIDDQRSLPAITSTADRVRTPDGYVVELRMGLEAIGLTATAGTRVAACVHVNHGTSGEQRLRQVWTGAQPDHFHELTLVEAATAPPCTRTAWAQIVDDTQLGWGAVLEADQVGSVVTLVQRGRVLASLTTVPWEGRALAWGRGPAAVAAAQEPLTVQLGETVLARETLPDLPAQLQTRMIITVQHQPAQFLPLLAERRAYGLRGAFLTTTAVLPPITIATDEVRRLSGVTSVDLRFYDREGRQVTRAAEPGRYGAEVTVRWANGRHTLARQTVLRLPPEWAAAPEHRWRRLVALAGWGGCPWWPPGVPGLGARLLDAVAQDSEAVRFLAAVIEEPDDARLRPDWQDRQWWQTMRTRRDGRAPRYDWHAFLPRHYDPARTKPYPAVLFLHGGGGDYGPREQRGPGDLLRHAQAHPDFPFVGFDLIAEDWWDSTMLAATREEILRTHHVDPDRVLLMGFSMGGYGTWQALLDTPGLYAAGVPIGGGPGQPWEAHRCVGTPIWVFNGTADEVTTCAQAEGMVEAVRAAGGTVRNTVQPDLGHGESLAQALATPELWAWLAEQRLQR